MRITHGVAKVISVRMDFEGDEVDKFERLVELTGIKNRSEILRIAVTTTVRVLEKARDA